MNPDIKSQWVAALRSGEYRQGRSFLHEDEDSYCCLGVLCDLAVKAGATTERQNEHGVMLYGPDDECSSALLPDEVMEWAGLRRRNPSVRRGHGGNTSQFQLAALNDSGSSFFEIADLIESYL